MRSLPGVLRDAHLRSLRLKMGRLEGDWRRNLEIDGRESDHAQRTMQQLAAKAAGFSFAPNRRNNERERKESIDARPQQVTVSAAEASSLSNAENNGPQDKRPVVDGHKRESIIHKVKNPQTFTVLFVAEAALYFRVAPRTIYRWVELRKLKSGARRGTVTIDSIIRLEKKRSKKARRT